MNTYAFFFFIYIAVFPDIKFESNTDISSKRNEDSDAIFVVNGSSRGIGLQFVISLLDRTKGKVIACCRSPSTTTELNKIATEYPDRIQILPLDVEDQSSIDTLAATIAEKYLRVDGMLLLVSAGCYIASWLFATNCLVFFIILMRSSV